MILITTAGCLPITDMQSRSWSRLTELLTCRDTVHKLVLATKKAL